MSARTGYVAGHSDHECRRLASHMTGAIILDNSCGVGEVSPIVAGLVGPDGPVTVVEVDARPLMSPGNEQLKPGPRT